MKKRLLAMVMTVAMTVGMVAGLSGCETDGEPIVVQGITDTTVLVANSAAASGPFAPVGVPFNAGIRAYFRMVNEGEGGVDGRQIEFLHYTDDGFDPVAGRAALEGMVEDAQVFALVGHFGTPVVAATIDDIKAYGIPAVYFATGIGQLYAPNARTNEEGFNLFPVQPVYQTEGRLLAAYAAGMFGASRVGVIYTNDDAGTDLYYGIRYQFNMLPGVEVVSAMVTAGSPDVSAAVTTIRDADVDFIIVASIQATMPTIVIEMAAQGMGIDAITSYVNVSDAMSNMVIDHIEGNFNVYGTGWIDIGGNLEDLDLFVEWIEPDFAMNAFAQAGWIAGHFFAEGMRRLVGQEVTWESYMAALESAPIRTPWGGYIDFSNGRREGTQEMNLSRIIRVSDEFPLGWEPVAPLAGISTLLGQ